MTDFLEKYSPTVNIFDSFTVDTTLSKEDQAFEGWKLLIKAKKSSDGLFLIIGALLKKFRDEKLYETLDYDSFSQFLASDELSFSRESAYLYIRTYDFYIDTLKLPIEDVAKMNVGRLSMMIPLLKGMSREDAITQIEDLQHLRHNEFVREVKEKTSREGRPEVYFSQESNRWYINYYSNVTILNDLGVYAKTEEGKIIEGEETHQGS
jgi:hypothetical protein